MLMLRRVVPLSIKSSQRSFEDFVQFCYKTQNIHSITSQVTTVSLNYVFYSAHETWISLTQCLHS